MNWLTLESLFLESWCFLFFDLQGRLAMHLTVKWQIISQFPNALKIPFRKTWNILRICYCSAWWMVLSDNFTWIMPDNQLHVFKSPLYLQTLTFLLIAQSFWSTGIDFIFFKFQSGKTNNRLQISFYYKYGNIWLKLIIISKRLLQNQKKNTKPYLKEIKIK